MLRHNETAYPHAGGLPIDFCLHFDKMNFTTAESVILKNGFVEPFLRKAFLRNA